MPPPEPAGRVIGWDVGGAHVKGCLLEGGRCATRRSGPARCGRGCSSSTTRWTTPARAGRRAGTADAPCRDDDRRDGRPVREPRGGVAQLADRLAERLGPTLRLYAPARLACRHEAAAQHWQRIASANWRASAELLARRQRDALLVDIGSTTTDLVPVRDGRVAALAHGDASGWPAASWSTRASCARRCARWRRACTSAGSGST
jgi:hypothetical protein